MAEKMVSDVVSRIKIVNEKNKKAAKAVKRKTVADTLNTITSVEPPSSETYVQVKKWAFYGHFHYIYSKKRSFLQKHDVYVCQITNIGLPAPFFNRFQFFFATIYNFPTPIHQVGLNSTKKKVFRMSNFHPQTCPESKITNIGLPAPYYFKKHLLYNMCLNIHHVPQCKIMCLSIICQRCPTLSRTDDSVLDKMISGLSI